MRGQHSKGDHRFVTSRARWALLTAVAASASGGSTAWGIVNRFDYYTGTGEQDWFNPAGWSDGTPAAEDNARVISSGTLDLSGSAAVSSLVFGYGPNVTPTLNLNAGGSLTSAGDVIFAGDGSVANGTGVSATLNQNGGNIVIPANHILWMGDGGSTTWNMSAGTVTVGYPARSSLTNLGIAIGTGVSDGVTTLTPTSTLNLSGGTINSDAVFELARNGATGVLNMTGGTINAGDEIWIGQPGTTGGQATITQSGGTIVVHSELNRGTAVVLYLPRVPSPL